MDRPGEDGGLAGVRLWAAAVLERAEPLLPADASAPPRAQLNDPAARDAMIAELAELEALLPTGEPLRPLLAARLGGLLGWRHLERNGAGAGGWGSGDHLGPDRERAIVLLREARSARPALSGGKALSGWEAQRAGLALAVLLVPPQLTTARPTDFASYFGYRDVLASATAELTEVRSVLEELGELPWPPEQRRMVESLRTVLGLMTGGPSLGLDDLSGFVDALPPEFPHRAQLQALLGLLPPGLVESATPATVLGTAEDRAATAEADDRTTALLLGLTNLAAPGVLSPEQAEALASSVQGDRIHQPADPYAVATDAMAYAVLRVKDAFLAQDPERLADAIGQLARSGERVSPTDHVYPYLALIGPSLLSFSPMLRGNLRDQREAERQLEDLKAHVAERAGGADGPFRDLVQLAAILVQAQRLEQEEDATGLERCIADLLVLRERGLPDEARSTSALVLGQLYQALGRLRRDAMLTETGMNLIMSALDGMAPFAEALGLREALDTSATAIRAGLAEDPELLRPLLGRPPAEESAEASSHTARLRALARALQSAMTGESAELDAAIAEFGPIREQMRRDGPGFGDADLLWQLADLHRRRGRPELDDHALAAQAMVESFEALATGVLLEAEAEHRLLVAREGASRALQAAWWAGSQDQTERAITMLELGRSMVLQATAATAELPELLDRRGHPELAAALRRAGEAQAEPGPVPSRLRRQVLAALGYGAGLGPFAPAGLAELNAGLRPSEADALVYLLPGPGSSPGLALVLGPDLEPGVLALPLLAADRREPLERYLTVSAERSTLLAGADQAGLPAVQEAWEQALTDLTDWAYPAVVGPVLHGLAERLAANPSRHRDRPGGPRLVLVPCGHLGVVPWHAARLPAAAPHRYVCEIAVLSYAASGREFLRAAARERPAPGARTVLVADPGQSLLHAEHEVLALRAACYPAAELYGTYFELPDPPVGLGTPEELLALLPGAPAEPAVVPGAGSASAPVGVLHIASHGTAATQPTVSALHLAPPPGGPPEAGRLTVSRLLDRPTGPGAAAGPLVVLSACETDLSTRDHDEALTLATAFLAAGAKDVVGSRWTTRDSASALMMAVFHHHLTAHGRSPADALQAAQRWMLDPARTAPPGLDPQLLREVGRPHLDRLPLWAAFVHHGHPGATPGPEKEGA
ncbi:CHAT domain-containing protein [Kitasatospora sp. MMS16-BH015]|uniref:CHAT domain-containing protein n=1 Tax=Kitasatospora sp. MMS16-BH015 TaxID=2018025 RepID=UPI000CA32585|nr:CHAT domain-containing protein [Kitasatospora sp. MMS16-BH015]AUG76296.1 CHAT domain-containing protein [Kitasatospora sp. MMS16-BH015]